MSISFNLCSKYCDISENAILMSYSCYSQKPQPPLFTINSGRIKRYVSCGPISTTLSVKVQSQMSNVEMVISAGGTQVDQEYAVSKI